MKKTIATLLLSAFLAVGAAGVLSSCGEKSSNAEEPSKTEETVKTGEVIRIKRYTAEEAYNSGRLTKDDIACALYMAYGEVYTCDEENKENSKLWVEYEFALDVKTPAIDPKVEDDIKNYFYGENEYAEDVTFKYLGCYNGIYLITETEGAYSYPMDMNAFYLAGFVWNGSSNCFIDVFSYE